MCFWYVLPSCCLLAFKLHHFLALYSSSYSFSIFLSTLLECMFLWKYCGCLYQRTLEIEGHMLSSLKRIFYILFELILVILFHLFSFLFFPNIALPFFKHSGLKIIFYICKPSEYECFKCYGILLYMYIYFFFYLLIWSCWASHDQEHCNLKNNGESQMYRIVLYPCRIKYYLFTVGE